jgi:hypothetical protein
MKINPRDNIRKPMLFFIRIANGRTNFYDTKIIIIVIAMKTCKEVRIIVIHNYPAISHISGTNFLIA